MYIQKIFSNSKADDSKLNVLVKGTNFQVKVWDALLNLHPGDLVTYQHIANQIGNPKALQAVGSAVGANSLAYLIPCHRVIRKEGKLGEYRWGSGRKKVIIAYEQTNAETVFNNEIN
ncbi:Bifunctional transcriptional activator/DNA repair enzyme Ada [compost metagenome]